MKRNPSTFWGWILETWVNPFKYIDPSPARPRAGNGEATRASSRQRPPLRLSRASKCVWQLDREG